MNANIILTYKVWDIIAETIEPRPKTFIPGLDSWVYNHDSAGIDLEFIKY